MSKEDEVLSSASALRALREAAQQWRESLGDSPETWLTGSALEMARAVDALEPQ